MKLSLRDLYEIFKRISCANLLRISRISPITKKVSLKISKISLRESRVRLGWEISQITPLSKKIICQNLSRSPRDLADISHKSRLLRFRGDLSREVFMGILNLTYF